MILYVCLSGTGGRETCCVAGPTALPKLFSGFWAAELEFGGASLCKPIVAPIWGGVGSIVNKRACDILLMEGRPVRVPSDHLTACADLMGIRHYFINPLPITHDRSKPSEVDPDSIRHPLSRKAAHSGQSKAGVREKVSIMIKAAGLINGTAGEKKCIGRDRAGLDTLLGIAAHTVTFALSQSVTVRLGKLIIMATFGRN